MERNVCIITGANSGIGYDTALKLAVLNYDVILACRNPVSGNKTVAVIKRMYPSTEVSFMQLDLASKKSIENFVKRFHDTGKKLHVLVNNAGVFPEVRSQSPLFTENGFENAFGTNHLGHFYLTILLLDKLKVNAPSRIVAVSSTLHDPNDEGHVWQKTRPHLDFENLQLLKPGTFMGWLAYSNSKLANVLFSTYLSEKLKGTGVSVNSLHPGFIPLTKLNRRNPCYRSCFVCFHFLCKCTRKTRSVSEGSDCIVYVATDETIADISGKYFADCREVQSSAESQDLNIAKKLWDASVDLLEIRDSMSSYGF